MLTECVVFMKTSGKRYTRSLTSCNHRCRSMSHGQSRPSLNPLQSMSWQYGRRLSPLGSGCPRTPVGSPLLQHIYYADPFFAAEQALVFAQPLARKVATLPSQCEGWNIAASASLSLMWTELSCVTHESRRGRLDLAFASYVLYVSRSSESGMCYSTQVTTIR